MKQALNFPESEYLNALSISWLLEIKRIMALKDEILSWDGKSAQDITTIYEKNHFEPNFIDILLGFIETPELQKGTTWLLKKHCENNEKFREHQINKIYLLLPQYEHWETKLHILQMMPYFPIPLTAKKEVEFFLRKCLEQNHKFIRAWSYNLEKSVAHGF